METPKQKPGFISIPKPNQAQQLIDKKNNCEGCVNRDAQAVYKSGNQS